jgi:hypothetical protein
MTNHYSLMDHDDGRYINTKVPKATCMRLSITSLLTVYEFEHVSDRR